MALFTDVYRRHCQKCHMVVRYWTETANWRSVSDQQEIQVLNNRCYSKAMCHVDSMPFRYAHILIRLFQFKQFKTHRAC